MRRGSISNGKEVDICIKSVKNFFGLYGWSLMFWGYMGEGDVRVE